MFQVACDGAENTARHLKMQPYVRALTIAGSDSGAGAGIQADLKTFSALQCYGLTVITAVTAQNTQRVDAVHPVPAHIISAQLKSVLSDIGADAIKIGMVHTADAIHVIADILDASPDIPLVLDPVLASQSGTLLLQPDAMDALKNRLFPRADLLTPNIPETEIILNRSVQTTTHLRQACRDLAGFGSRHILIKGGHRDENRCTDWLFDATRNQFKNFSDARIQTPNDHGTGCTLSSAITAFLAHGETVRSAVPLAKTYLSEALAAGRNHTIGQGRGPLHHFYPFW